MGQMQESVADPDLRGGVGGGGGGALITQILKKLT